MADPADREHARRVVDGRAVVALAGDLTAQQVDVVVNAANEQLRHGGGVAAAVARAGGPRVQAESDAWVAEHGEVGPGQAAVTTGGDMAAGRVVHVVGPRYHAGQANEGLLRQAVRAALDAARDEGAASVALPMISTGVFGYPPEEAARVIAAETAAWLAADPGPVEEVRLVGFDDTAAARFARGLEGA
jgi:O-acetyl-ADP-ribose deacetylase